MPGRVYIVLRNMGRLRHIDSDHSMMEAKKRKTAAGEKGARNEPGIPLRGEAPLRVSAVGQGDGAESSGHRDADTVWCTPGVRLHGRLFITQPWRPHPLVGWMLYSVAETAWKKHGRVPILAALRLGHGGRYLCKV